MSFELGYLNDDEIKLLSKETGLSIHQIQEAQKVYAQTQIISLDAPTNVRPEDYAEGSLMDLLASDSLGPEQEALLNERNSKLLKLLETTLKPREYSIIRMRFGFETGSFMTLEEIGSIHGVTRERIRQIETKALTKLRRRLKQDEKSEWFVD